jgi:transcriptional regulator with XRE-family HTH domain
MRLRTILENEFLKRRTSNPRYSLRAFARSVNVEHSTLSQLLRGKRPLTWKSIRTLAASMRWTGTAVLHAYRERGCRFDSRRIAEKVGISTDEVNVALADLCMFGLIELKGE